MYSHKKIYYMYKQRHSLTVNVQSWNEWVFFYLINKKLAGIIIFPSLRKSECKILSHTKANSHSNNLHVSLIKQRKEGMEEDE